MSKIDYSKIFIQPQGGKSTCHIFVLDLPTNSESETSNQNRTAPGQIFGLIEVEAAPTKKINSFINSLIQEIRMAALSSFGKNSAGADSAFENLIQKTNYRYIELIGDKSLFASDEEQTTAPNINAIMVFENEKNLYLAQRGGIIPLLVYQVKPQNYKIINIADAATGREGRASNINLFTNIVSGRMNIDDYLIFTTESLLDYFSLEKICKTISSASPEESANALKQTLAGVTNLQTTFAAVILKLQSTFKPKPAPVVTAPEARQISLPQNSMAGFLQTAANTEKMLTPSLGLNLGAGLASFLGKVRNLFKKKSGVKDNARLEYYSSQFSQPARGNKLLKTISLVFLALVRLPYFIFKQLFLLILNLLKMSFYLITNRNGMRRITIQNAGDGARRGVNNLKNKFGQMPRLSRALFIFAVIFVFLFLVSTGLLYRNYQNQTTTESLSQKIEAIQNKKSAAEASLIYNDEVGAGKSLAEAEVLLAEFPQKTKSEKQAYQNLIQEIAPLREKLRHIVNLSEPSLLADVAEKNPAAETGGLVVFGNTLYAFDRFAPIIYEVNLATGEITDKNTATSAGLEFGSLEDERSAILYQPEKKFFIFDSGTDSLEEIAVALNENENSINNLATYNQKLYVLDTRDNQIFKHAAAPDGFSRGTPWLKENLDLANSVSLAIDGSIFVAKSNGELLKLNNGQKVDFPASIDPALSSPKKIWTSADSNYIYILEPAGKRLVVLDKEGKSKVQYFSEKFGNLRDFLVSEKEKKIYLLSDNKIYSIDTSDL